MGAGLRQSGGASPDGESGAWERVHWSQDSQSKRYQILYTVQRETAKQFKFAPEMNEYVGAFLDEFEQTLGDSEGQGSLACCHPWGHRVGHD